MTTSDTAHEAVPTGAPTTGALATAARATSASPLDARDLRVRVQQAIDAELATYQVALAQIGPELEPVFDSVKSLLTGGKRLRAACAYWGWRGVVGSSAVALDDAAIKAASSLEFLHACALAHDDVMDASDTRRGLPSAHRVFESMHRDNNWRGSAAAFGEGAAVLIGDLLLSWADDVLFRSGLPAGALLRGKPVYDEMRTELMAGQYLDLLEQASGDGSEDRVMRVARYKTAKYTIERPLHLGGALAGAPAETLTAYSDYGLPLGEAFQLRDDVLGVFGDPKVTGKPAGDDLREGKRTLLIHATLHAASSAQRAALEAGLGNRDLDVADIDRLREVIVDSGGLAQVEERISSLRADALTALAGAHLDAEATQVLTDLAFAATARES
jgi:geranylgeranyl diphosphate synthase type I